MTKLTKQLVIIDSPSECGKTSLCLHLATKYRFNYYHIKRWNYPLQDYEIDVLDFALKNMEKWGSCFVIERLHLSDEVYNELFHAGNPYANWENFNQHIINKCDKAGLKYTLVTCLPPKSKITLNTDVDEKIYDAFKDMYKNNKELIYNYDFTKDPDYIKIDKYLEDKE